ncbi:BadF/BadG/BcrA/BcrD ATPase family protein [Leifsonia sp. NPDC080035]|uniref:BadF/BadG/BcrA/BcrD ATPase family protein n=1 Tax=Leifsonia sp. NPDC080035 TaxID=3143936 RepID=A0AAU7G8R5_9MICO
MTPEPGPRTVAVDLGKTTCRVRVGEPGAAPTRSGPGAPGLASDLRADAAFAAIASLLATDARDGASATAIGIGAAGVEAAPDAARRLAERVAERWNAGTVVASDVLTAHLGAFAGAAGTVLIAGTGAVAVGVGPDGDRRRADGWGPWLGDEGSGRWIGQQGLVAALRAGDGRGAQTILAEDAAALAGGLAALPGFVGGDDAARRLASFAPTVLRRSAEGDPVAAHIVAEATRLLAATASAVSPAGGDVAVVGGLADDHDFLHALEAALREAGLAPRRPLGSAIDGAAILARRHDLPHERYAIRV